MGSRPAPPSASGRPVHDLSRWALAIGVAGVLVGCGVGLYAYVASRDALLEDIHDSNQRLARVLALHTDALGGSRSTDEVLASLQQTWLAFATSYPGSRLRVIDGDGKVALDSVDPGMVGAFVGDMEVRLGADRGAATVSQILGSGGDAVGVCSVAEDPGQVGAFAHSRTLKALIGVFVPGSVVDDRVRATSWPWAAGMAVLGLGMTPASFGLLYRAFRFAQGQLGAANVRLMVEVHERREAESRTRTALKEKEVLLHEVYHRVKNNLQIVASLLSRQAAATGDRHAAAVLQESRNRVHSMALVHQQLYQSGDLTRISVRPYLVALTCGLFQSYGVEPGRLALEVEDLTFPIEAAIPVGLVVNELVTNAVKHAFPDGRRGQLSIRLALESADTCRLVVADDGCGRQDTDLARPGSLGLRVVSDLARQLGGQLEVDWRAGAEFRLTFPFPKGSTTSQGGRA